MKRLFTIIVLLTLLTNTGLVSAQNIENPDTSPPGSPVKLIFIHHSTGGNWLADSSSNELGGGLGQALMENNYFVSATNYGWGPDSIGDATDIPNWLDWFRGERSAVYLDALYNENGQNFGDFGSWPRLPNDPGGENQIVVFKSCFPNSDLEGKPDDPASPEGWLSVSNAKYTYNELLKYFVTRPDKLFVVITAPPLSQRNHSANARAFNEWLVNDWLEENAYPLHNVAVFDFYNILTGPENHHRVIDGKIEHVYASGKNTLYYPSGDDHPSRTGNEKATDEFVPLLNAFYHDWIEHQSEEQSLQTVTQAVQTEAVVDMDSSQAVSEEGNIFEEDFENSTFLWTGFNDEGGTSKMTCGLSGEQKYKGSQSLQVDYSISRNGWGTCALFFDTTQDWSNGAGLSFAIQVENADSDIDIDLYSGSVEQQATYVYRFNELTEPSGWISLSIPWSEFKRVDWEEGAGEPLTYMDRIVGMAFGIPSDENRTKTATFWVDSIKVSGELSEIEPSEDQLIEEPDEETTDTEKPGLLDRFPFCSSAAILPLGLLGLIVWSKRKIL